MICVFAITPMMVKAQSSGEQREIKILIQRVDSLENELANLKMFYEITSLNNDINKSYKDVEIETLKITLFMTFKLYKKQYWKVCKDHYESLKENLEILSKRVEQTRTLLITSVLVHSFPEEDVSLMFDLIKIAENSCIQFELSLDEYELAIDNYRDAL